MRHDAAPSATYSPKSHTGGPPSKNLTLRFHRLPGLTPVGIDVEYSGNASTCFCVRAIVGEVKVSRLVSASDIVYLLTQNWQLTSK